MKFFNVFRLLKTHPKFLISACTFAASAPAFAFQQEGTGVYANSQLTASMGAIEAQVSNLNPIQFPSGRFSVLGVELEQTFGWSNWVSLDMFGGYGVSVGGGALGPGATPAQLKIYDLGTEMYSSIPCIENRRLFLEPMVGFFGLKMNARNNTSLFRETSYLAINDAHWFDMRIWGPMVGLFLRMIPVERLMLRVGGAYLMPRIREKNYFITGDAPVITHYDGARSGALASFAISYEATAALSMFMKLDYRAFGAASGPVEGAAFSPHIIRSRLVWGTAFTY